MNEAKKLDIGCGAATLDGWHAWDIINGHDARKLDGIADGQLDAIKASHVLEHISHRETLAVLREWSRALRHGGELFVAVPDFDWIVSGYQTGNGAPIESFLMGGHNDQHDKHQAIFNRQKLTELLSMTGFDVVGDWAGDANQCSALPVSLNLHAVKRASAERARIPLRALPDVHAVMSLPRLAWTENIECCWKAFSQLGMPFVRTTGVFWTQCIQRVFQQVAAGGKHKWVLAVDFDTIFDAHDILALYNIAESNNLDVLCPLQIGRDRAELLAKVDDGTGKPLTHLPVERLADQHWPVLHGHFGLTLIRVDRLREMPLPWFIGYAGANGDWGTDRVDDDVYFWKRAAELKWKISTTPLVRVGHLQMVATWPDSNLQCAHQFMPDFHKNGRPSWTQQ